MQIGSDGAWRAVVWDWAGNRQKECCRSNRNVPELDCDNSCAFL